MVNVIFISNTYQTTSSSFHQLLFYAFPKNILINKPLFSIINSTNIRIIKNATNNNSK